MQKFPLLALIALSGCGSPDTSSIGRMTRSEAEALNDAATMVDENAIAAVNSPACRAPRADRSCVDPAMQ
jgi:hypothetical protein